jgi:aspartate kinase
LLLYLHRHQYQHAKSHDANSRVRWRLLRIRTLIISDCVHRDTRRTSKVGGFFVFGRVLMLKAVQPFSAAGGNGRAAMLVLRFGGTSVADADAIRRAGAIVSARSGARVVVVSALAGVTDALLQVGQLACTDEAAAGGALDRLTALHHEVARAVRHGERRRVLSAGIDGLSRSARSAVAAIRAAGRTKPSTAASDRLVATGELWSSRLVAALFEDGGIHSRWLDSREVVRTDARYQGATPDLASTAQAVDRFVRPLLASDRVVVIGGFIGSAPDGSTTTLGRGGSDYSAALVGACLSADEIQIWTDVDGILTADPRVVAHARLVERLSYAEAHDLATFGAKVLHPGTIHPAEARGIPVRVLNSWRPEAVGTIIGSSTGVDVDPQLTAVASRGVTLVEVTSRDSRAPEPFAARVFRELAHAGTSVVLADLCGNCLSVAVDESADLDGFRRSVGGFAEVRLRRGLAAVCAVGRGWSLEPRLIRDALVALGDTPVFIVARPSESSPLAFVVAKADAESTMKRLHDGLLFQSSASAAGNFPMAVNQ